MPAVVPDVSSAATEAEPPARRRDYSATRIFGFPVLEFLQGIFNLVLVGTALVGSFVIYWQWKAMEAQLRDARQQALESRRDTDRALSVAESQASSLRLLAESTQRAAEVTQTSARASERARVYVASVRIGPESGSLQPVEGKPLQIQIYMGNFGRTSAQRVVVAATAESVARGKRPTSRTHATWDEGTVPANGEAVMSVALTRNGREVGPLSEAFVAAVKRGEIVLYAHGRIDYTDVYGVRHWLKFCRVYKPRALDTWTQSTGSWWSCEHVEDQSEEAAG